MCIDPCGFCDAFLFWLPYLPQSTDRRTKNIKENNNIMSAVCELLNTPLFYVLSKADQHAHYKKNGSRQHTLTKQSRIMIESTIRDTNIRLYINIIYYRTASCWFVLDVYFVFSVGGPWFSDWTSTFFPANTVTLIDLFHMNDDICNIQ